MAEAQRIKTDEQALEAARLFAQQIRGESAARDRERRLPVDEIESFSQTGLWGITVPKEYGGPGVSTTTFTEVVAIVSEADASIGQIPQNHYANVEEIRLIGTEAQKKFFFDRILKGERLGNAAVERSGKNVIANQTRLEPDGDGYRLSGEKFYCTGALFAHWVPVRVTNADGKRVLAIVNRHSEGLTVIDDWSAFGQKTTASGTVVLKDVRVSSDQILPSYEAYQRPTTRGPFSQIIHVAIDVGIARAAIADTIEFVKNRSRPWIDANVEKASDDPLTIQELGKLQYQLHVAEALMERSALKVDRAAAGLDDETVTAAALAVAEAKIAATEISIQATNKLFELAGTQSTLDKYGLDRHWRNARVHTLHDPVRWKYYALGNYYLNGVPPPRHAWI